MVGLGNNDILYMHDLKKVACLLAYNFTTVYTIWKRHKRFLHLLFKRAYSLVHETSGTFLLFEGGMLQV